MAKQEIEQENRMARLEKGQEDIVKKLDEHIKDQKEDFQRVFNKLDEAVDCKADKEHVNKLDDRFWGIVAGMLFLLAGIIGAWFKR